jgi:putative protein-disulfide isomerase
LKGTHAVALSSVAYLFDPLCGWCYGAAPRLQQLHDVTGVTLTLVPTGLFSGDGARPMDKELADYAWSNDQRIARLSGQRFTDAYREKVLQAKDTWFDSAAATLALTAVSLAEPAREFAALKLMQAARYVDGRDIISPQSLVDLLIENDFTAAAARLSRADGELIDTNAARMARGRRTMALVGARGVPTLVVGGPQGGRAVNSTALFGGFDALLRALDAA